jgi:hypothetical protein
MGYERNLILQWKQHRRKMLERFYRRRFAENRC